MSNLAITDGMDRLSRPCTGDAETFTALLRKYEHRVYAFISRMMDGNPEDAADLTQETFLKAYRGLAEISPHTNFNAWLYRIATNTCVDELRRRRRQRIHWQRWYETEQSHARAVESPEHIVLQQEAEERVRSILRRMTPRKREALILREVSGLSCEEIGGVLGGSRQAMKSLLFRARQEYRHLTEEARAEECRE